MYYLPCPQCGATAITEITHYDGPDWFAEKVKCENCGQVTKRTWKRGKFDPNDPSSVTDGNPATVEMF